MRRICLNLRNILWPLVIAVLIGACTLPPVSTWHRDTYPAWPEIKQGIASWYGPGFHGRRTSSGEVYDQHAMTAAHRTLPLGTRVRVTRVDNGRSIEVRINDRGPFVDDRIIDLSYSAAKKLGMVRAGTTAARTVAKVVIRRIDGGALIPVRYAAQVAAFRSPNRANSLRTKLAEDFPSAYVVPHRGHHRNIYQVRVGPFPTRGDARRQARKLADSGVRSLVVEEAHR